MKRAIVSSLVAFLMLALIVPAGFAAAKKINFTIWTKESEAEGVLQEIVKLTEDFAKSRPGLSFEILNYGVEDLRQNFNRRLSPAQGRIFYGLCRTTRVRSLR